MIITLTVPNDHTPIDLILYRRFGGEIPGLVEATYRRNPTLGKLGPMPPRGTTFQVETDDALPPTPGAQSIITLYD